MNFNFLLKLAGKGILPLIITGVVSSGNSFSQSHNVNHPVFKQENINLDTLKKSVDMLLQLSIPEVIAEVPSATGLFYIGCPNCNGGAQEVGVLSWRPGTGDTLRCRFCQMTFPNDKFPYNKEKIIIAPSGARQVYRYYENPEGRQYYFEASVWFGRSRWIQSKAEQLARLWLITKDNAYGDRAAAILGRFAQVFPDYTVKYEFPNDKKKFFPG